MAAAATVMARQTARRRMPSNGSRDGFGVSDDGACMMDSTHVVARQLTSDFNDLSYNHLKGYLASVQVIVPRTRISVKGVQHRNRGRKNLSIMPNPVCRGCVAEWRTRAIGSIGQRSGAVRR